jgi:hypothetical protein
MSIVPRFTGDKCPTCGTEFSTSMHPFDVAFREEERKRRSRAAKKGWKKRKAIDKVIENSNRDKVRWPRLD